MAGDVNQILSAEDKAGGQSTAWWKSGQLWNTLNSCEFIDIGFSGPSYT